ncbi:hypothetical protein GCM10010207_12600 [Streptomyces atratus]|uniref:hypothetical protein n=1 Tax=Streptomyces atratus TaxID=1893 RepID=UPI001670F9E0|nr:hypothetical protein [Streptomyces atratus]GGT15111.1 hypothetical protein GCM10010207_12600 [Streptomyces atratus]
MRTPLTPLRPAVERGYRFEALRYGPATGFVPEPIDLRILAAPQEAVRAIRIQLRANHLFGLTPRELIRALHWADQGGWVQALATLHRGEPCGFTLMLRGGRHIEWTYRSTPAPTTVPPRSPSHGNPYELGSPGRSEGIDRAQVSARWAGM